MYIVFTKYCKGKVGDLNNVCTAFKHYPVIPLQTPPGCAPGLPPARGFHAGKFGLREQGVPKKYMSLVKDMLVAMQEHLSRPV